MNHSSSIVRLVYAVCMTGATWNHARILFEHGLWWNYGGIHPFYAAFWTSLTFFDALAVLLLLARPRAGVLLTTLIIACDVLVNASAGLTYGFDLASFAAQCIFMLYVLGTVRRAWHGAAPLALPALQVSTEEGCK